MGNTGGTVLGHRFKDAATSLNKDQAVCVDSLSETKTLGLESRGPRIDPFRASGPKWGRKWPKNGFWPCQKNGGSMARKMAKNGPKFHFRTILGPFFPFSGPFSPFCGPFSPHFSGKAKMHVSAIFVPISGRRPEMDLYEVHGIPTLGFKFSA